MEPIDALHSPRTGRRTDGQSPGPSSTGHGSNRIIVDKNTPAGKLPDTYQTFAEAIENAEPGDTIRITPDLYTEQIKVTKPGLVLEPSLRGGEIILQQKLNPCVIVDVGPNNSVTINNIKMLLTGPNMDVEVQGF
jgi:hypothetical protein